MKNKIHNLVLLLVLVGVGNCYSSSYLTSIANYIIDKEGFVSYQKPDGKRPIIGYSTSVDYARQHGYRWGRISKNQASRILICRILDDRKELCKKIVDFEYLPEDVIVAVHSAYFNSQSLVGPRLTFFLNTKQFDKASRELAWGHSPNYGQIGLVNRRFCEANRIRKSLGLPLFKSPNSVNEFYKRKRYNLPKMI